jgi:hypothetical protein
MAKKQLYKPSSVKKEKDTKGSSSKKSSSSSKPTSTTFTLSIVIVGIAIAVGGYTHWSSSNNDASVEAGSNNNNNNNSSLAIHNKATETKKILPPTVSIARFHTIDESLGDLRRLGEDDDDDDDDEEKDENGENNDNNKKTKKKKQKLTEKQKKAMQRQVKDVMTYLQYDDGYVSCLTEKSGGPRDLYGVLSLKKAKYQFLLQVANLPQFWTIQYPSTELEVFHLLESPEQLLETSKQLMAMCRFLTLTHEDYDGRASKIVQQALAKPDFVETFAVRWQGPASEYRTRVCLSRLTDPAAKAPLGSRATAIEKMERDLLVGLRFEWSKDNAALKQQGQQGWDPERPRLLPEGWLPVREETSGHLYYYNQHDENGTSIWERPVPIFGGKGVMVDDPPPTASGKVAYSLTIARKELCAADDTRKIVQG